jgi:sugar phosphate isomerase/epimerase
MSQPRSVCPAGTRVIDFGSMVKHLRAAGFDSWAVVEQDVLERGSEAARPLVNATAGREYLRNWVCRSRIQ